MTGWEKETQLWPRPESQCPLPNFPRKVSGAVGFWTTQGPTVCGGFAEWDWEVYNKVSNSKCFLYKHHQWNPWTNMRVARSSASAIQINSNQAFIIGGYGENNVHLNTTELISSSGPEAGKDFPVTIAAHCSFKINATHAMVTGGSQDSSTSASTWYVDLTTTRVTPGPTMKTGRSGHGCAIFQHGTKSFGIVAGGYERDSTEIIELDQESPEWTDGMQDKSKIVYL